MAIELLSEAEKQAMDYSLMSYPVERLVYLAIITETFVKLHCPSATILFTEDRKHKRTHIAVYDSMPTLNPLGFFLPLQQKCPQQLGERQVYQDDFSPWYKARQLGSLWSAAAFALHLTTGDLERYLQKMGIKC